MNCFKHSPRLYLIEWCRYTETGFLYCRLWVWRCTYRVTDIWRLWCGCRRFKTPSTVSRSSIDANWETRESWLPTIKTAALPLPVATHPLPFRLGDYFLNQLCTNLFNFWNLIILFLLFIRLNCRQIWNILFWFKLLEGLIHKKVWGDYTIS